MFQPAKSLDEALASVTDGCMLVVPREVSGVPMAATRALIRRGVKRLHLVALPTSSLQADLLIGAGCVATLETSAVSLGEFGPAPRFTAAITGGTITMKDATCPALHAALAGGGEGRAVHAAARADRLRRAEISRRLESDRQPIRQFRSDRAAAGDQAGRRALARADGRPLRQCLDRAAARIGDHGACGGEDRRHRGENSRRQSARRSGARRRHAAGILCREHRGGRARLLAARLARSLRRRCRASGAVREDGGDARKVLPIILDKYVYDRRAA